MCDPSTRGVWRSLHARRVLGWQPGSLAVPIWTLTGLVGGGLVGSVAAGPMTPIRWLFVGIALLVGVVAYFALVYMPDPGFDF